MPAAIAGMVYLAAPMSLAFPLQIVLTVAIVTALGPLLYRVAYQPLAEASVLVLLIVSVAAHFTMIGLGLWFFGAEGSSTPPFTTASFVLGEVRFSGQSLLVLLFSVMLIGALYLFFDRTLYGKALRATALNRVGARLVGMSPNLAGSLTFILAAMLCAFSGVLIGPITTIYYDSGFLISLKGFVGAIIGGLSSYPLAAAGSVLVGLLEVVLLVLGQRVQGGHRVHADHPGPAVALADHAPPRGGRMTRGRVPAVARWPLRRAVRRARRALCAAVLDHAAQLHRPVQHRCAGTGAADRRRGPDLVRAGGVRRHRRLCDRVPVAEFSGAVAVAEPGGRARADDA